MNSAIDATNPRVQLDYLALEAGFTANMANAVKSVFPELMDKLRSGFVSQPDLRESGGIVLSKDKEFVLKELAHFKYVNYMDLDTVVPEGFVGNFIEYCEVLQEHCDKIVKMSNEVLQPYYVYLSTFVTNKDSKISTKSNLNLYKQLEQERKRLHLLASKFFMNGSFQATRPISSVIRRNEDFKELYRSVTDLESKLRGIDVVVFNSQVKSCVTLLDSIILQTKTNASSMISPEAARNLAEGAYEIAREIEFFATTSFAIQVFIQSVNELTTKMKSFITAS